MGRNSGGVMKVESNANIDQIMKAKDDGRNIKSTDINVPEINKFKIKKQYDVEESSFGNLVYSIKSVPYEHDLDIESMKLPNMKNYNSKEKYAKDSKDHNDRMSSLSKESAAKYAKDYNIIKNRSMKILIARKIKELIKQSKDWEEANKWIQQKFKK